MCCESVNSPSGFERQKNRRVSRLIARLQSLLDDQEVWITGEALADVGRYSELDKTYCKNRVRADRADPAARWYLAETLAWHGDAENAVTEWRKALVLRPDAAPAAIRLAQSSFRMGEPAEAVRWLKRIVNRRPGDDRLKIAALGLCLCEGHSREARALAEVFLDARDLTSGTAEALFHVFRLFDDTSRARRAAGLDRGRPGLDTEMLWLAARAAIWSVDGASAVTCLSALGDASPGGHVLARKALAQQQQQDTEGAALTLASAAQLFLSSPGQLADLAASLSVPGMDRLRQVVLSTLQRLATDDAEAAAALALAHYRLGDWQSAQRTLDGCSSRPDWPELEIAARNMTGHRRVHGSLPSDAAGFAFKNDAVELFDARRGTLPTDADSPLLLVLGDDLDPGERELLMRALAEAAPTLSVIEFGDIRSDTSGGEMSAALSECFHGTDGYQFGAAGRVDPETDVTAHGGLGYLPPHLTAEIAWLGDQIERIRPGTVHIAGASAAVGTGLAALGAGVGRIRFHAGPAWLARGQKRQGFFQAAVTRLLQDRRCRLVTGSGVVADTLSDMLQPANDPLHLPAGTDGKAARQEARLIHRLRASEVLDVAKLPEGCALISVFGLQEPSDIERFVRFAEVADGRFVRFVQWSMPDTPGLPQRVLDQLPVVRLRWPGNAGAFLVHCRLGLAWGKGQHELQALAHAAVSVPVLAVDGADLSMPSLGQSTADSLPGELSAVLDMSEKLEAIAEEARLWAQSNRPFRRMVRRIRRLDGYPDHQS